jgi:hypothetical protein
MTTTVEPALKDDDAAHPVASVWRSTFHEIVKAFAGGDFGLTGGVASVAPVSPSLADRIRATVSDYGETLSDLPDESWKSSVAQWMGTHWDVLVDLWTEQSGQSDLVLHAHVFEVEGGHYRVEVDSVHVP